MASTQETVQKYRLFGVGVTVIDGGGKVVGQHFWNRDGDEKLFKSLEKILSVNALIKKVEEGGDLGAKVELAELFLDINRVDEAAEHLEKASGLDKDEQGDWGAKISLLLGRARMMKYQIAEAIDAFVKAEEIDAEGKRGVLYDAMLYRAVALIRIGKASEALTPLEKFIAEGKENDNYPFAVYYLGLVHYNKQDLKSALNVWKSLVKEFPAHELSKAIADFLPTLEENLKQLEESEKKKPEEEKAEEGGDSEGDAEETPESE